MRLEHIGIAVEDIDAALETYSKLLDTDSYKRERVDSEHVDTIFLWIEGVKIELLSATSEHSTIYKFIQKRGPGLHHLAFEVNNIAETALRLVGAGFHIISDDPARSVAEIKTGDFNGKDGADGKRIFFVHPKDAHGVLIECCSRSEKGLSPREYAEIENGDIRVFGRPVEPGNPPVLLLTVGIERFEALRPGELIPMLEPVCSITHIHLMDEDTDIITLLNNDLLKDVRRGGARLLTLGISSFEIGQGFLDSIGFIGHSWIHIDPHRTHPPGPPPPDLPCLFISTKSPDTVARWPVSVLPRIAINPMDPMRDALLPVLRGFWEV